MGLSAARLLLVGCGKMGGALLRGWFAAGAQPGNVIAVEPSTEAAAGFAGDASPTFVDSLDNVPEGFAPDIVMFAVKPQSMDAVVPAYRRFADTGAVFMSIAAGTPVRYFEKQLGDANPVVRAMPNTPAAVGRGVTAAICNPHVLPDARAMCDALLAAVGEVVWVTDEAEIDAVTAVSGSGPAYVFHLVEAMTAAGIAEGLSPEAAGTLARATVSGAGELLFQSDEPASTLRQNVTSPGGTTAAALDVLMAEDGLTRLMTRAVAAAANRSRELGG